MTTLYTAEGKKVEIQHPVDVIDALNTGNYFEKNPVQVKKVDPIAQKHEEKLEQAERGRPRKVPFEISQAAAGS